MTTSIIYKGHLRCECTHTQSGTVIETDAPTDNKGKGEKFSPTDLVATSLASCILTTMGIKAESMGIDISNAYAEATKHMLSDPRRIGKIEVTIQLHSKNLSDKDKIILERAGNSCPVKKSLHPDLIVIVHYEWV